MRRSIFESAIHWAQRPPKTRKWSNLSITGLAGTGVAATCAYISYLKLKPVLVDRFMLPNLVFADSATAVDLPRNVIPAWQSLKTRSVQGVFEMPFEITLMQYETCPYCSKVRAFLDYYGLPYKLVEVNPLFRGELKAATGGQYRKVPLIILNDKQNPHRYIFIPESALIISLLKSILSGFMPPPSVVDTASRFDTNKQSSSAAVVAAEPISVVEEVLKFYPMHTYAETKKENWFGTTTKQITDYRNKYYVMYGEAGDEAFQTEKAAVAYKNEVHWREWVDKTYVHSLAPNIYRTLGESVRTFRYLSEMGHWEDLFPAWKRELVIYVGAVVMWVIGKRVAKRHELSSDPRFSMYSQSNTWLKAVGGEKRFMGGEQPNLADLSVFGVLSAIEGTDAFRDLSKETRMGSWYFHTKQYVTSHAGVQEAARWLGTNSQQKQQAATNQLRITSSMQQSLPQSAVRQTDRKVEAADPRGAIQFKSVLPTAPTTTATTPITYDTKTTPKYYST